MTASGSTVESREWSAWQCVVAEFQRTHGTDINDPDAQPLVDAIRLWGERLAWLRCRQTLDERQRALAQSVDTYTRTTTGEQTP